MVLCVSDYQIHYTGLILRGHHKRKEREHRRRPLVSKIFAKLVTALSSSHSVYTYCCTSGHRTKGTPLQSTTLRTSLRLEHLQRIQGTGRRSQWLNQVGDRFG